MPLVSFYTPWKQQKNQRFSVAWKVLNKKVPEKVFNIWLHLLIQWRLNYSNEKHFHCGYYQNLSTSL